MDIRTFTSDRVAADEVLARLADHGYEVGAAVPFERMLLDTFDGRIAAAGLRLAADLRPEPVVTITGAKTLGAQAAVAALPRFVQDLPPGPMRARLGPIIGVRALLPRLTMTGSQRSIVLRNSEGRPVAQGHLYEGLAVAPRRGGMPAWTVEVAEIAGHPKPAKTLRRRLADLGLETSGADTLDAAYVASGVSHAGFDPTPTIPLPTEMPALEGYAAVLDHLADAITANWQPATADLDPEFLHDLRVAVRRTRSVLSQAKHVIPPDTREHFRDEFKWLGDITTPARDLDVYVLEWDGYIEGLDEKAALEPVLAEIERRRAAAHADLTRALRDDRAARLMPAWRQWLADPRARTARRRDSDRPLGRVVTGRIQAAQEQLLARGRSITDDTPGEALHELRKDAKRLRYLLECFGGVLATGPRKTFVKRLKSLQDNLGEHQDAEVHVAQLRELAQDLAATAPPDTLLAMGRLVHRLEGRRQASRDEFAQRFRGYDRKSTRVALDHVMDITA